MLEIILIFFATALGFAAFNNMLYYAIQEGQIFGAYQKILSRWDLAGHSTAWKMLGGCAFCTFNFLSFVQFLLLFIVAAIFHKHIPFGLGWFFLIYFPYTGLSTLTAFGILKKIVK